MLIPILGILVFTPTAPAEEIDRDAYLARAAEPAADRACARTDFPQSCFAFKDQDECRVIYKEELSACLAPLTGRLRPGATPAELDQLLPQAEGCVLNRTVQRLRLSQQFVNSPECEKIIEQPNSPRWWSLAGGVVGAAIGGFLALRMVRRPKDDDIITGGGL